MKLEEKKVVHSKFGPGKIIRIEDRKIYILFQEGEKKFLYPQCFENFLKTEDTKVEAYIQQQIDEEKHQKEIEQKRLLEKTRHIDFLASQKVKMGAHAVFDVDNACPDGITDITAFKMGQYVSGNKKGQPRIPKRIYANSACILTKKEESDAESGRVICGIYMPEERFCGEECKDGIVPIHEMYKINWEEQEEITFWDYFSNEKEVEKWKNGEVKYIPKMVVNKILQDMVRLTADFEKREKIVDFLYYFKSLNQ